MASGLESDRSREVSSPEVVDVWTDEHVRRDACLLGQFTSAALGHRSHRKDGMEARVVDLVLAVLLLVSDEWI